MRGQSRLELRGCPAHRPILSLVRSRRVTGGLIRVAPPGAVPARRIPRTIPAARAIAILIALGPVLVAARVHAEAPVVKVGEETLLFRETPHPLPVVHAGEPVWSDVFRSPGASYIAVHFAQFSLAPGERVVVSTPDGARAYTFEGEGKPLSGGAFWATHVPGDTCVVTVYGTGAAPGFGYVVDRYAHGWPAPSTPAPDGFGSLSICGADDSNWAKCYETTEPAIYAQGKAIVRILVNGSLACTGWLVGCDGHIMTSHHCIASQADAGNTDYEFMAEGAGCATNCASFGACPGVVEASSGTLVKTDAARDYSLVLLPDNLSLTYGYFIMRDGPAVVGERITINGHPEGWGKRFAIASTDPSDPSGYCQVYDLSETACETGGPPDVGYFCDTQGGSSGSPVVATSDAKVVALHHCADCPNRGVPIQSIVADLRASEDLPACATRQLAGSVEIDRTSYRCAASVVITVRDDSLAGNPSQTVSVASTTETTAETVVLMAAPPGSGTFTSSVFLTALPPVHGDGKVSVADGGALSVTYVDADDGAGGTNIVRSVGASIDCVTPVISDVVATSVTGSGAVLSWTTSEPATSEAHYGSTSPPAATAMSPALEIDHDLPLSGLPECTGHLFSVTSRDAAGNTAVDDGGGAFYTFTTVRNTNPVYATTGTPVPIPDNDPAGALSSITVTSASTILDLNVKVDVSHTYDSDLVLRLLPPSGPPILLAYRRGGSGEDYTHTVFDDEATSPISTGSPPFTGSFRPEAPLSAVDGMSTAGVWTLKVVDAQGPDSGSIDHWSLAFTIPQGVCGPSLEYAASAPADACSGSGTGGGDGVVDPGEGAALSVTLHNNGTAMLTNVGATLTSTTSGVLVTRGEAAFPDVAAGQSMTSFAPHFAFAVDPSVPCGAMLGFTIHASASQGSWSLPFTVKVGGQTTTSTSYNASDVPRPIPDLGTAVSTLTVQSTQTIVDADVGVTLTHTYDGDLTIDLVAPDGTTVALSNRRGGPGVNYTGTIFDDEAAGSIATGTPPFTGRFRPEQSLSVLDGKPLNGTWTLRIVDHGAGDSGDLTGWFLAPTSISGIICHACSPVPLEAGSLSWLSSGTSTLAWSPAPYATSYALYRGTRASLPALLTGAVDSCTRLLTSATNSGAVLSETPAPGALHWYLVAGRNAVGEGSCGAATAGSRIVNSSGPCP